MRLIVNADDFGLSHEVNMAIVEAFEKGYISNTTIMTNMPGFEEAIDLSKEHGFFDKVGLHLNLFEGVPLTEDIKHTVFGEYGQVGFVKVKKNSDIVRITEYAVSCRVAGKWLEPAFLQWMRVRFSAGTVEFVGKYNKKMTF